jgi:hypothetical protein
MYFTLNIWTMYKIYRKLFNRFRIRAVNCMNERVHEAKIYTPWYILGGGGIIIKITIQPRLRCTFHNILVHWGLLKLYITHLNKGQANAQTTNYQKKFSWLVFKLVQTTLFIRKRKTRFICHYWKPFYFSILLILTILKCTWHEISPPPPIFYALLQSALN